MSESKYSYTRDDRIKCEENWEEATKARDNRVVECPHCHYRMMKQFWLQVNKKFECPRCGKDLENYTDVEVDS